MPYFNSYQSIVSAVTEAAEDDSQEFLDYIPKSMELAQLRLQDELDLDVLNTQVQVTCIANSRYVLKPTGFRFANDVFLETSTGGETPIKQVSNSYLRDFTPNPATTGVPRYYSVDYNADYLTLAPTPTSAYKLNMEIRQDVVLVSTNNPQNYFTQYCGNALFFGTMKEQAAFMKYPEMEQEYEAKYLNAVQGVNNRGRRARRQDGGTASTNESGKNTFMGTK